MTSGSSRSAPRSAAAKESVWVCTSRWVTWQFFDWITHDKGYARKLTEFGDVINPLGIRTIGEFPNLTAAMLKRGWSESRIRKVIGENWVRLLREVWGA